jgi:hypothetical protein
VMDSRTTADQSALLYSKGDDMERATPLKVPLAAAPTDSTQGSRSVFEPIRVRWHGRFSRLGTLEILTVTGLIFISAWCARPLLEEWGFFEYFANHGISSYPNLVRSFPLRPLQGVPPLIMWLVGQGHTFGMVAVFAILVVMQFAAARWAVTPLMTGVQRWIVATLASVLAPWPAGWLLRLSSAHLAAIFFIVALGAAVRLRDRMEARPTLILAVSTALVLATYQALFLCLVSLPLAAWFWVSSSKNSSSITASQTQRVLRVSLAVSMGILAYAVYAIAVSSILGSAGYEGELASSNSSLYSISGVISAVAHIYNTAYLDLAWIAPMLMLILAYLTGPGIALLQTHGDRVRAWSAMTLSLIGLPLLALPYVVSPLFPNDPDRVLFPVSVGFVLLCFTLMLNYKHARTPSVDRLGALVLVTSLMIGAILTAYDGVRNYWLQDSVLKQTISLAAPRKPSSLLLRDYTGTLGDVYTLLPPTLTTALSVRGLALPSTICTPLGVDRIHPDARRFPIATTPRCEDLPAPVPGVLTLDARIGPEGLSISLAR